jgi:hypothetical protein
VREALADRREAQCRSAGRAACTAQEFRSACAARDRARLGPPLQSRCAGGSCTQRWTYAGPFRPDTLPARARLLCSIVTDAAGNGLRSSIISVTGAE